MTLTDHHYLQINQALFSLAHAYESRMTGQETRNLLNLNLSDCSVMMVLGQFQPINSRQLARLMDLNPGTISIYLQRLVEKGLVQKDQDKQDRRNWTLTLTQAGQAAYQGIVAGAVEYTKDFLAGLDEVEQEVLHRLLLKASHDLGFEWQ